MPRPSTIDRQPAEIRQAIATLRGQGRTIDEILDHLKQLDVEVSRSALGRHIKHEDAIAEDMRRARAAAEALVKNLGEAPDDKLGRLNVELLQGAVMKLLAAASGADVAIDAKSAMQLAITVDKLSGATKKHVDTFVTLRAKVRAEIEAEQKRKLDAMASSGKAGSINPDQLDEIRRILFGG